MWRLKLKILTVAAFIIISGMVGAGSSYAATCVDTTCLVGPQGDALGIDGLVVDGMTYNVTFEHEAYDAIFGCDSANPPDCTNPPTFYTSAEAIPSPSPTTAVVDAATALFTALNALHVTGIAGISGQDEQNLLIPFGYTTYYNAGDNAKVAYCLSTYATCFNSNAKGSWIYAGPEYDDVQSPNSPSAQNDYAVFTATPLPPALPLFASVLGGLGLLGWRRKRKAQAVDA